MARQTKAEKMRVLLAQDVQAQLRKRGGFRVETGSYIDGALYDKACAISEDQGDKDARTVLKGELTKCTVCAKGALFIAHIIRNDKVTVDELIEASDGSLSDETLVDAFTNQQWAEIEALFEDAGEYYNRAELGDTNFEFLKEYAQILLSEDDKTRLSQIMQLIIDSNGKRVLLPS